MDLEILALATLAPSLLLLWYFRSRDVYPEPAGVVWSTFGLGVLTAAPVLAFALPLGGLVPPTADPLVQGLYSAFVLAAIPEEFFKWVVMVRYARRHSAFDEPMDGLVYGVAASLGFATLENVLYVASGGLSVALMRSITAIPAHATMGAIMGYYVGQAHFTPARTRALLWRAYWVPMVIHGLYDFPLLGARAAAESSQSSAQVGWLLLLVPVILLVAIVWSLRLSRGLRALQLVGGLDAAAAAIAPALRPGARRASPVWWLVVIFGGALITGGALVGLVMLAGLAEGEVGAGDAALAGGLLGALPAGIGALLFRYGVRRLNQHDVVEATR